LARELTHKVYSLTEKAKFARDFGLKGQIQDAPALPFEVSSRHTSGGLAYEQGQSFDRRKKGNPASGPEGTVNPEPVNACDLFR